ncbi:MAG: BatD family protein [Endomicrobia bacterium]|nr:BatD family protein [Endomicrobiia bacterium]MCL2506193.1 BatD family protein [Endomicrobiia bacterium]
MKKLKVILLLLIFTASFAFANDISFSASVNRNTIALNESLVLSLTVSGDVSNLPDPMMGTNPNFNIYSSGKSQNRSIINGKVSGSVTHNYTLSPKTIGKFTIPPVTISYNGKTYSTQPIQVEVTAAKSVQSVQAPQPQQNNNARQPQQTQNRQGNAFVKASTNKTTVFENEKVIFRFSFYTNMDLVSNPEYTPPDFAGFWNDGSQPKNRYETIDGVNYSVTEVETILYPIGSGTKTISPARLRVAFMDFSAPSNMGGFFDFFMNMGIGQKQVKELTTDPIKITVLPLPLENRPADFSGAVGDFKIKAVSDKTEAKTNDPITITVTVSGAGNFRSVTKLDFDLDSGFRKYDTIVSNTADNMKEFKTIIVPLTPGEKVIPPVRLSFFNPSTKKFTFAQTQEIKINVTGDAVYKEEIKSGGQISIKKDINYNKPIENSKSYAGYLVKNKGFYLIFVPFILLFAGAGLYRMLSGKINAETFAKMKNSASSKAQKYIQKAENEISKEHFDKVNDLAYKALIELINSKAGTVSEYLDKQAIFKNLKSKKVSAGTIAKIEKILEEINFYRFASVKADKKSAGDMLNKIKEIISELK